MVQQIFLSIDARPRDSWREAFPKLIAGRLGALPAGDALVWALLPAGQVVETLVTNLRKSLVGRSLVLLADEPSENDAMAALAAGAAGYCNGHAAPQVLRQVAMVVENGGIWVGQGLMQRLLAATSRLLPAPELEDSSWRRTLTAREQEAASLLAKGASNKEIARQLDITERTVKSHVSAMLDKLGVRDRLQLSLIINGIGKQLP
ncbi:response regulator transcription factor [Propionivibrio sp.]|uniref:response regulator transcription factor n=1 Tax=Propionivibrio sp. TaxID=2212460 RepID=UPI002636BB20|nr:response regulator transcription factor [Propionivibrio sp.]